MQKIQTQDNRPTLATITVDAGGTARINGKNLPADRDTIARALENLLAWLRSNSGD